MKITGKLLNQRLKEKINEVVEHYKSTNNPCRTVPNTVHRYSNDLASAAFEFREGRRVLKVFLWQPGVKGTWYDFTPTYSMVAGFERIKDDLLKVEQHNTEIDIV